MKTASMNSHRRCRLQLLQASTLIVLLSAASTLTAGYIQIGAGAQVQLNGGMIQAGCADMVVDGQLDIGEGTLTSLADLTLGGDLMGGNGLLSLSGQFQGGSGFQSQTGTVTLVDGCGFDESSIVGSHTFHNLDVVTQNGRLLTLPALAQQRIENHLGLAGGPGNFLLVRSSQQGSAAELDLNPAATQTISWVDVADNWATGQQLAPGAPEDFNSVDSGNLRGWFAVFLDPVAVPLGNPLFWVLLIIAFWMVAGRRLISRSQAFARD